MDKNTLMQLSKEDVLSQRLPLVDLLVDSLYYPNSRLDGGVIKYSNIHLCDEELVSFVYSDYSCSEKDLISRAESDFIGYHVYAHRPVSKEEIGANKPYPKPKMSDREIRCGMNFFNGRPQNPFCHWVVMERDEDFGEEHGPKRFSLLFINGDGVAVFAGLYGVNNITPKVIAFIEPGYSYPGFWTDFADPHACLYQYMKSFPSGMPKYVFYGGTEDNYDNLKWEGYGAIGKVQDYYRPDLGSMTIYKQVSEAEG